MSLVGKGEEGREERPIWRERVMDYDIIIYIYRIEGCGSKVSKVVVVETKFLVPH
jgi:hypothetical protein